MGRNKAKGAVVRYALDISVTVEAPSANEAWYIVNEAVSSLDSEVEVENISEAEAV